VTPGPLAIALACLERPVLIWRVGRHWLADVPHFYDFVTAKAEQVNGGNAGLALTKHDLRVHRYEIAIAEHILDQKLLARKLDVVLNHRLLQHGEAFCEEWIMMLAIKVHVPPIGFIDLTRHDELQKVCRCLSPSPSLAVCQDTFYHGLLGNLESDMRFRWGISGWLESPMKFSTTHLSI